MKGHHIAYTADELAWLEANRALAYADFHRAFCEVFGRVDVSADNLKSLRQRKGWRTGRTGCFAQGHAPANKGKAQPYHPNSAAARFQKGVRRGRAIALYKPIGSERVSASGYLERKINDDMPLQSRWRAVHLIGWEAINGPLPEGMCLKALDGDKRNVDPANWELIERALLPRLIGRGGGVKYDAAPAELKPTILAIAKLQHKARSLRKRSAAA